MTNDLRQRMQQLVEEFNRVPDSYYSGCAEPMTDFEWDAKFDELKRLGQESGLVLPDSPTTNVSNGTVTGQKEAHELPILSLAKTKKSEGLVKRAEERPIWPSWKLDGLIFVVTYDDGKLTKIAACGNGYAGTNITHLALAVQGTPATIKNSGHLVIRGEAVISHADFGVFNMEADEACANPRNPASGSLMLKNAEEVERRRIQWIPFTLVLTDEAIDSWGERLDWLREMGLNVVKHERINDPSIHDVNQATEQRTNLVTHNQCPSPVGGLVITSDDMAFAAMGSIIGYHATRTGPAFKWEGEAATTELKYIGWPCAASTISPVAVFRPVELEGTAVKRASLCNIGEYERLGIDGPGSVLSVIKANKIIPKVIKVVQTVGALEIPHECLVYHHQTRIGISKASGTRTLHRINEARPVKQLKKLNCFVSKNGVDIDGISEQTLAKFINLGWLNTYADVHRLPNYARQIVSLEGFGNESAGNMMRSIEKSRTVEVHKFLYALTIPMCGVDACKRLLDVHFLYEFISKATEADTPEVFTNTPGAGSETSAPVVKWFQMEANRSVVDDLLKTLNVEQLSIQPTGARCEGLIFVTTGDVHRYKNRAELKVYIENQGGHAAGSVSKPTNYPINNNANFISGKNKKAKESGTEITSGDQFRERPT